MNKCVLILLMMLFTSVCFADKYQFEDSAENEDAPQIPICRDFLANLKALGEPSMVCDRKFHPKFKQFTLPKWKNLDAWENRELIFQIWDERYKDANDAKYSYAKDSKPVLESSKHHLKKNVDDGNISLSVTRVDIDNIPRDVLRFEEDKLFETCNPETIYGPPQGRQYYIIDLSTRKVDFKATENSMQFGIHGNANEHYADLFLYKGLPYAAFWYGNAKSGKLVIKGGDYDYCFIEYDASNKKGEKK